MYAPRCHPPSSLVVPISAGSAARARQTAPPPAAPIARRAARWPLARSRPSHDRNGRPENGLVSPPPSSARLGSVRPVPTDAATPRCSTSSRSRANPSSTASRRFDNPNASRLALKIGENGRSRPPLIVVPRAVNDTRLFPELVIGKPLLSQPMASLAARNDLCWPAGKQEPNAPGLAQSLLTEAARRREITVGDRPSSLRPSSAPGASPLVGHRR